LCNKADQSSPGRRVDEHGRFHWQDGGSGFGIAGSSGGMRSQIALKMVLDKLGVTVIPQSFALGAAHQAFDQEGLLLDNKVAELVSAVGASLVRAAAVFAMR
jgi:hypothetical protein